MIGNLRYSGSKPWRGLEKRALSKGEASDCVRVFVGFEEEQEGHGARATSGKTGDLRGHQEKVHIGPG
jgi:hypothetical protein